MRAGPSLPKEAHVLGFHDREWLPTFCRFARLLHDDPEAYAKEISYAGAADDLLVPRKVNGSDQSITRSLIGAGILRSDWPNAADPDEPFIILSSWLNAGFVGSQLRYERVNGRDTVNGRPFALSHMHKDFTNLLGVYLHVREIANFDGFGRIPIPGRPLPENVQGHERTILNRKGEFALTLIMLYNLRRASAQKPLSFHEDPFSRRNIIQRFYRSGDFSPVFCDRIWWQPGVWAN